MYKKLLSSEYKNLISGVKLSSILIQFTYLVFPLSMYIVYNKVIASKNPNTIIIILLFLLSILVIQLILKLAECLQKNIIKTDDEITKQKEYIAKRLQENNKIYSHYSKHNKEILDLASISKNVDSDVQNHVSHSYLSFLFIYLLLVLIVGKYIVIVPIIFFSINYLVASTLSQKMSQHNENYKNKYSKKNTLIREILLKVKTIKGLNANTDIINKYKKIAAEVNKEKCSSLYLQNTILKASMVINIINTSFILLFGRYLFSLGILNIEQIITCSLMTVWVSRPMAQLFASLHSIKNPKREITPQTQESNIENRPNNNVEFTKIKDSISKNKITYYKPNNHYKLDSFYRMIMQSNAVYQDSAFIDENFNLFYGSIIDNITVYEQNHINQAKLLIQQFNLEYLINNLPYNYNYVTTGVHDDSLPFDLKVGIEIIREIIRNPSLVIINIDENRVNRFIVNGLKKYIIENNINLIWLKSDKNINKTISEVTKVYE